MPTEPAPPTQSTGFPATMARGIVVGGALWTASVLFFVAQAVAQAASAAPYSLATNLISDLGNTACTPEICSPLHALVNAAFVVTGVCHAGGALAAFRARPRGLGRLGAALLVAAGAGLAVAGLAPENVNPGAHAAGALGGLVCLNLGMLAVGLSTVLRSRWVGRLARGAGIVGLVGTGSFLAGLGPRGISERLADYPGAAMVVVLGVVLLLAAASARRAGQGRRAGAASP